MGENAEKKIDNSLNKLRDQQEADAESGRKGCIHEPERPKDAEDLDALWLNSESAATSPTSRTTVSSSTSRRTSSAPWRIQPIAAPAEVYTHKIEDVVGETHYIIAPSMRGRIEEARPCQLVTVVYRDGTPRLWPIKSPKDDERDNEAWISARSAARWA